MKVRDVMTKNPVTISPEDTVDKAWRYINRFHIWTLPVIAQGKIVGVVTKSDLKRRGYRQKVSKIMTTNPLTISPDKQASIAADIMQKARINALLVTEDEKIVGIITRYDIDLNNNEKQNLEQIKERIEQWKNEGYNVVDLEKMVESLEEQETNNTDVTEKSKKTHPILKILKKI